MSTNDRKITFRKDVARCVNQILVEAGFRSCEKYSGSSIMVVYVKPYSQDIAFYLFFRDGRARDGYVTAELWFAPIQFPDDSIEDCGCGIKLDLSQRRLMDDATMMGIARKACNCLPYLSQFQSFILDELKSPFFSNERGQYYRYELEIYRKVCERADLRTVLDEVAKDYRSRKIGLDVVSQRCKELVGLLDDDWSNGLEEVESDIKGVLLGYICAAKAIAID